MLALSVIVSVYNAAPFLAETVSAVRAQTWANWELLLYDDGSTDGSADLARRLAAEDPGRICCLSRADGSNRGPFITRVRAAAQSRSDVLALLDADDLWSPDYLAPHCALWVVAAACGAVLSYGPALYWHTGSPGTPDRRQPMPAGAPGILAPGSLLAEFLRTGYDNRPCPSCTLLRRSLFSELDRFSEADRASLGYEDQSTWWYAALRYPVVVHTEACVRYGQTPASSSSTIHGAGERARQAELAFLQVIEPEIRATQPVHPVLAGLLRRRDELAVHRVASG